MITLKTWNPAAPAPGFYRMPAAQYHADPCPAPSLSSGSLIRLLDQSPAHAHAYHPKLGGLRDDFDRKTDIGSAVHRLVLDAGQEVEVIAADSYRSKAAQEARQLAEASGKIPILADDYEVAKAIAPGLRHAAETYLGCPIDACLREVVVIWKDGEAWRRAMVDVMTPNGLRRLDLKTTRGSAAPHSCVQRIFDAGYQLQVIHYGRGVDAMLPETRGRAMFGLLFGEVDPPYCTSPVIELSEGAAAIAREQHDVGGKLWDACLKHDYWPGYDTETLLCEPPPWYSQRWLARMNSDHTLNPVQPA